MLGGFLAVVQIGWKLSENRTPPVTHLETLERLPDRQDTGLSDANLLIGLHKEGIQQAKETSEIFERLRDTITQAYSLLRQIDHSTRGMDLGLVTPDSKLLETSRFFVLIVNSSCSDRITRSE
jgi:hypothetical protein